MKIKMSVGRFPMGSKYDSRFIMKNMNKKIISYTVRLTLNKYSKQY